MLPVSSEGTGGEEGQPPWAHHGRGPPAEGLHYGQILLSVPFDNKQSKQFTSIYQELASLWDGRFNWVCLLTHNYPFNTSVKRLIIFEVTEAWRTDTGVSHNNSQRISRNKQKGYTKICWVVIVLFYFCYYISFFKANNTLDCPICSIKLHRKQTWHWVKIVKCLSSIDYYLKCRQDDTHQWVCPHQ